MKEVAISLTDINRVYKFVSFINKIECDVDLRTTNRRYTVDAKSIMGVLSLDLSEPVVMCIHTDNQEVINNIIYGIDNI